MTEKWWVGGVIHRHLADRPAVIKYFSLPSSTGKFEVKYKAWWVDGKNHRIDGPAEE